MGSILVFSGVSMFAQPQRIHLSRHFIYANGGEQFVLGIINAGTFLKFISKMWKRRKTSNLVSKFVKTSPRIIKTSRLGKRFSDSIKYRTMTSLMEKIEPREYGI